MSDDEIKDFLKDNEVNNYELGVSATLTAIVTILIKNNITTQEEFKRIRDYSLEKVREQQIKNMTNSEKENIEAMKKFSDLFGGFKYE